MFLSNNKIEQMYREREVLRTQLEEEQRHSMELQALSDFYNRRIKELREQISTLSLCLDTAVAQRDAEKNTALTLDKKRLQTLKERDGERQKVEMLVLLFSNVRGKNGADRETYLDRVLGMLPAEPGLDDLARLLEGAE